MPKKKEYLFNTLREVSGGSERSKLSTVTNIKTGKTEIIIEKTIVERYPIEYYDKAVDLYERLNCGGGRKVFTLAELSHHYNPDK